MLIRSDTNCNESDFLIYASTSANCFFVFFFFSSLYFIYFFFGLRPGHWRGKRLSNKNERKTPSRYIRPHQEISEVAMDDGPRSLFFFFSCDVDSVCRFHYNFIIFRIWFWSLELLFCCFLVWFVLEYEYINNVIWRCDGYANSTLKSSWNNVKLTDRW